MVGCSRSLQCRCFCDRPLSQTSVSSNILRHALRIANYQHEEYHSSLANKRHYSEKEPIPTTRLVSRLTAPSRDCERVQRRTALSIQATVTTDVRISIRTRSAFRRVCLFRPHNTTALCLSSLRLLHHHHHHLRRMTTTTKKKCADKIPIVLAVLLVILSATVMSPSHAQEQSNVKQAVPYPLLRGPFVCDQREIQVGRATRGLSYGTYILTPLQTPALTPIERTAQMINVDLRDTTNSLAYQRLPMPVVVFAAGLMADILSVRRGGYITTLDALCSHGFVVVASRAGVEVNGQTLADGEDTPVDEHLLEIMLWLAGAKSSSTWGSFGNVSAHDYFQPYGGLDLDRVGLMGHSLGSAQAQRIAAATRGSGPAAHFFDGSMPRAKKINVRTLVMLGPVCGALQDCCFTSQRCGNPRWARAGKNRITA